MVSPRRFGAFLIASVVAITLIPMQALPASAADAGKSAAVSTEKIKPLPVDDAPKPELEIPVGDFTNPPPAHVEQVKTPPKGTDSFDPANSRVVEQTEKSTIYVNPNGTRTAKFSQEDLNAKDEKGNWRAVDNRMSKKDDGRHHNGFGKVDSSIADSADDDTLAKVQKGSDSLSFSYVDAKKNRKAKSDGNIVKFEDVADGVDLHYQSTSTQLKETIVLKEKPETAPTYRFQ